MSEAVSLPDRNTHRSFNWLENVNVNLLRDARIKRNDDHRIFFSFPRPNKRIKILFKNPEMLDLFTQEFRFNSLLFFPFNTVEGCLLGVASHLVQIKWQVSVGIIIITAAAAQLSRPSLLSDLSFHIFLSLSLLFRV